MSFWDNLSIYLSIYFLSSTLSLSLSLSLSRSLSLSFTLFFFLSSIFQPFNVGWGFDYKHIRWVHSIFYLVLDSLFPSLTITRNEEKLVKTYIGHLEMRKKGAMQSEERHILSLMSLGSYFDPKKGTARYAMRKTSRKPTTGILPMFQCTKRHCPLWWAGTNRRLMSLDSVIYL